MQIQSRELRIAMDGMVSEVDFDIADRDVAKESSFTIVNMSRSGMFVASDDLVEKGTPVRFSMALDSNNNSVSGVSTVKWVRAKDLGPGQPKGIGLRVLQFFEDSDKQYNAYLESRLMKLSVSDLMRYDFPLVSPEMPVKQAITEMRQHGVSGVCVVDSNRSPQGFLTEQEIFKFMENEDFLSSPVSKYMVETKHSLKPQQEADDAYKALRFSDAKYLPVLEGKALVGVLVTADMLPFWGELMELKTKRLTRSYEKAMSIVVHDLRSPIGAIKSTNLLLTSDELEPEEYVACGCPDMVNHSCDVMLTLIDDLLDISAVKQGKINLNREHIDLGELIERVSSGFQAAAVSKGLTFELEIDDGLPLIHGDPIRLEQVMHNLVSNAFKFSPSGESVKICARDSGVGGLILLVKDTGQGIPKGEISKLFKEFSRISVRPTAGEKSTGLGLAITKKLVEAHGGNIGVNSVLGKGTTFNVFLPLNAVVTSV